MITSYRDERKGEVYVTNLREVEVKSSEDSMALLYEVFPTTSFLGSIARR